MKTITKITMLIAALLVLASCSKKQSLQEYYVDNQTNPNFLALDVPSSLIMGYSQGMNAEQRKAVESVKKVNLLAFPKKMDNTEDYDIEKKKLQEILKAEKYNVLMKFNQNNANAKVMYLGEEDAIDEIILYGEDYEKGFGVARLLGDNMNPENLLKAMESLNNSDLDLSAFGNFAEGFN